MKKTSLTSHNGDLTEQLPGLFSTPSVPLPFLEGQQLRSYVIQADQGPVVIYNTPGIDAASDAIRSMGQPARQLVNHWHEEMYGTPELNAPTIVHERDRRHAQRGLRIDDTFDGRIKLGDDLEVIPSLAHTAGASMFLWDNGEHRFLFPGDSFWNDNGTWRAVILGESSRKAFIETLELMRDLDFDVMVPWAALDDASAYELVTPAERTSQVNNLLERVRRGASGAFA
jgi:glyoxylase-like metal-dependent hydrolase (beta-lactamase superfamily II)